MSTNSYANDLYKQIQSQRKNAGIDHSQGTTNGAEKSKIISHEQGYQNNVDRMKELSRLYRMGLSPEREIISEHFIEPTADGREGK